MQKVIFWINDTDVILEGARPKYGIGGANVQMVFWAKCFAANGFDVYTFTREKNKHGGKVAGVKLIQFPVVRYIGVLLNYFTTLRIIAMYRPDIVVTRAVPSGLGFLVRLSHLFKFKLVHMLASDADVDVKSTSANAKFQQALRNVPYIVAQNDFQLNSYKRYFQDKEVPVIPNIWDSSIIENPCRSILYDVIWVANIKKIKRPDWLIAIAQRLPQFKFALIGLVQEESSFDQVKRHAEQVGNLDILGYKSLLETNEFISKSRLLLCTSVVEGFPNTFLQAWSSNVPVVSTVNPNGVITGNQLGRYSETVEGLVKDINDLLSDHIAYKQMQLNIANYFSKTHAPEKNFTTLLEYILN